MPQRKKDSCSDKPAVEVQADHELFLQAFEKPTQIYRYLRTRNLISPIFLQRTLYYMKERMSRNHRNRSLFKSNELLFKVQQKVNNKGSLPGTFLNLVFTGFHDKKVDAAPGDIARVETHIVKICHKKRKEASAPLTQVCVGTKDVQINPTENVKGETDLKPCTLSIPTQHFMANNGHQVKSYLLVFRVSIVHDQENVGEPLPKRRRLSRNVAPETLPQENGDINGISALNGGVRTSYGAELVVYDRHSRCQLTAGQYEIVSQPFGGDPPPAPGKTSPKKNINWESIDTIKMDGPFQVLENSPVLKFNLCWTEDNTLTFEKPRLKPLQPLDVALANSAATKPKPQDVSSPEAPQLVLYQFVYNNNSRQQTEARRDFHCPWCSLNCCTLYSLLKHLKLCHNRFTFTYVPHQKGARIDVALNECYDGSYAGNPQDLVAMPTGCAFTRSGPTRRTPTTSILVCLPKRPKPSLSEFLEQDDNDFDIPRSYILGHNRLYHHTMTCLPVQPHELDEDSEGDHDSEWVRTKTKMMIDEFSDVNEGEKEVMKLWNLHVMKYNFVGDCQLPLACSMFIENHGSEMLERNLYRNFILHLVSLHDFGLIGAGVVYKSIIELQKRMEEESIKKKMILFWENQKENSKRPFHSLLKNCVASPVSISKKIPIRSPSPQHTKSSEALNKGKKMRKNVACSKKEPLNKVIYQI